MTEPTSAVKAAELTEDWPTFEATLEWDVQRLTLWVRAPNLKEAGVAAEKIGAEVVRGRPSASLTHEVPPV
jgi:hypothetical protein